MHLTNHPLIISSLISFLSYFSATFHKYFLRRDLSWQAINVTKATHFFFIDVNKHFTHYDNKHDIIWRRRLFLKTEQNIPHKKAF